MKLYSFLCLFFLLSACNVQEIEKYNPDFKGSWKSLPVNSPSVGNVMNFLTVDGKDGGIGIACQVDCPFCNCASFYAGRVKINTSDNTMQVGGTVGQIFNINEEPFINEDGEWELIIDNVSYFKYQD